MSESVLTNEDVPMTYLHLENAGPAQSILALALVNQLTSEIQWTHLMGMESRSKIELNIHFQVVIPNYSSFNYSITRIDFLKDPGYPGTRIQTFSLNLALKNHHS